MTQQERVLDHLKTHGSITPLEALSEYGIYRLSVAIWRLRKQGYPITTVEMEGVNRFGETVKHGKYILLDRRCG